MFRHFPLLTLVLPGCIIYDHVGSCKDGAECAADDEGYVADTAALEEEAPAPSFTIDPASVQAGTTFIATVTAENFDLSTVTSIEVFGQASLLAEQNRGDELLLTVSVSAEALTGDEVDILFHVGDDVLLVEAAITVSSEASAGSHGDDCE